VADFILHDEVWRLLADFQLPGSLGFGEVSAPVMFSALYEEGRWSAGELMPYGQIELLPGARVLHYAELVFEGLKAYRFGGGSVNLFRARENYLRFHRSAERIAMPPVPEGLFFKALHAVAGICAPIIPARSGQALYLRPFLFGTEPGYFVRSSKTTRFMVIANPVQAYAAGPMSVVIEREQVRAARGGVGSVKTAGNYAASLLASTRALRRGFTVTLWLDPVSHQNIEELSGMNFFAVFGNELHTPSLGDSILPGITRDSLLRLAQDAGLRVVERSMQIDELLDQISSGHCTEVFASGTAAIVAPISVIADADGREFQPRVLDVRARELRERLLAIQERREQDPYGWVTEVPQLSRETIASG
jgi:branched-chain amino acid aminotransferase